MFPIKTLLSLAFPLICLACGPSCKSVCDDQNECPNHPRENCADYCRHEERTAHDKGCTDELDAYISCLDALDNLCALDLSHDCTQQWQALSKCEGTT